MRTCRICNFEKDLNLFENTKDRGITFRCKSCLKIYNQLYRQKNIDKLKADKKRYWQETKEERNRKQREFHHKNKERLVKAAQKYYRENLVARREYAKKYSKTYTEKHREEINKRLVEYTKKRKKEDAKFKLIVTVRSRICRIFKDKNITKRNSALILLGTTIEMTKKHLEDQFRSGMTWENHGEWEIDHIIPLSSGKTTEDIEKLCHYTNLQPLWKSENRSKGAKIASLV